MSFGCLQLTCWTMINREKLQCDVYIYTPSRGHVCVFTGALWADCMCCLASRINATIPLCFHTNTCSLYYIVCFHSYWELQEHFYQCWLSFHNIYVTLPCRMAVTDFFLLFSVHNLLCHVISPLFPLTCISVSDSSPVRGLQTQTLRWRIVWTGWSHGCPKAKVPPRTSQMMAASRAPGLYKGSCHYFHLSSS